MATAENVSVSIRVRPLNARESGVEQAWRVNQGAGSLTQANLPAKMTPATYTFDHVFDQNATSAQVYNDVAKNVVISAMGGINGTVFCYGQTGSGKTHTMHGTAEAPGIVPAAIHDIFSFIQKNPERAFMLRCSYWEIYNEAIKDLLQPSNEDLQIREAVGRGIFVADCKEEIVVSAKTMLNLVALGNTHRHTSETRMNEASSRSHSIFRITIESHLREKSGETTDGAIRVASLNLVDLAGSERQSSTGAEGAKLKEGSQINKSLLILGNVISKLSEGKAGQHIPYRDSKLTRILEPALGGNSRTAILCTVTTAGLYGEETHSTLKFASKAKKIQNCTQVNEVLDDAALMRRYKKEISELRTQIANTGLGANLDKIRELEEEKSKLSSEGEHMAAAVSQLERKLKNLESFMITASLPVAAPVEKRTSVSRHSWAPGKGSRYDANAAPICLLPPELQDQAAAVKSAWSDAGSVEEVQALREMAELLRQENEALRASGASSGGDSSMTAILEAQTNQIQALTKELRDITAKCSSLERSLYIARAEISTLQLKNTSECDDIQAVSTQFTDKIAALVAELEQTKAQLEAVEEKDFQKGMTVMKLEDALAKSNAEIASSANMHARDISAANASVTRAQEQIALLQEQLDTSNAHIESLSSELASATESQQMSATQFSVLAVNLKETEEALAFEKQMFSDLENKFMELQSKHTDAAAATFDSKRQTMAKSTDAASLRREIMAMETIQKDLEKSKEKLQKELTVVKSEYSLLKDKLLQETTALKEELHVAKGELRSVKGDASNIGRTAESREKEVDRLKSSIKTLEETKKTLQADKAAVTGEKMNLELQLKSTSAKMLALEKENEKLRDKAGKIGEARSEAQQAQAQAAEEAEKAAMALEDYKMTKEQLIATFEENESLRTERSELHSLLSDTAQELDQKKQQLIEAEDMIDATAAELESAKAEAAIKTSDLQALSAVLSEAEEQYAAAAAAAAATEAAASDKISKLEAHVADISSQLETASNHLAEATAAVASLSAAADEAQRDLLAKSQQIAQLQLSLADAEEQLVSITAREARSTEAEARRNAELQAARDSIESLQLELAEVQRAADEAEGRLMELCEGNEALNQELHAAKVHISAQADEKEQMLRAAAVQAQQLAEKALALEDSEAQKNQANESLAMMGAKMDEMEDKVAAQEKTLAQANARYEQAQTKLDKLEGKAGSFEHISGVVKDQNESLAKELSALRRQVEELESQLQNTQDELKTERALSKVNQDNACDEVARAREEIKRAQDSKEALQRQLNTAKASGGSGSGSDQSMLSLMLEVEELKSKLSAVQAPAVDSKNDGEYAKLMKKYSELKQKMASHEKAALEQIEKSALQVKKYKEKLAAYEAQGVGSMKQRTALAEDKENVKAQ